MQWWERLLLFGMRHRAAFGSRKNIKKFARKTVDRLDDLQGDIRDQVASAFPQ